MSDRRYARQLLVNHIGEQGQSRIAAGSAVIIGCGALGTVIADALTRAGVGRIRIVDRDFVELDNLQRQVLFDEEDARRRLPKAVAAANRLKEVNSSIEIEPLVCDANPKNVEDLVKGFAVLLDATDNIETRFLLNDACVKAGIPWVYGAAVGSTGMTMSITPGRTPCFRCFVKDLPPPGSLPTCDREGVLQSAASIVAHLQAVAALKVLVGATGWSCRLVVLDVWTGEFKSVEVARRENCVTCGQRRFEFLSGRATSRTAVLCGRNAVQVTPPRERTVQLDLLASSLERMGEASYNGFLLTLKLEEHELIVFPTGRAIVKGTSDPSVARKLYAKYIGT